jgi:hypothetical protein
LPHHLSRLKSHVAFAAMKQMCASCDLIVRTMGFSLP